MNTVLAYSRQRWRTLRLERAILPARRGWALYEAQQQVRRENVAHPTRHGRLWLFTVERPVASAISAHLAVAALVALGFVWDPRFLSSLTPSRPDDVLSTAWQVHAGFVAIAFAGLALLIDMAGRDSLVRVVVERRFLIRETQFAVTFFFSLAGAIQLGVVSTWFASPGSVLVDVLLVVTPSILYIGIAYARTISALTDPIRADETAAGVIVDELKLSMDASRTLSVANDKFEQVVPLRLWGQATDQVALVTAPVRMRLKDVHLPSLQFIVDGLAGETGAATSVDKEAPPTKDQSPAKLERLVEIGNSIPVGGSVFTIADGSTNTSLQGLERLLRNAISWESL